MHGSAFVIVFKEELLENSGMFYARPEHVGKVLRHPSLYRAGGGRQALSSRFARHFTQLCVPPPSDAAIRTILSTILGGFLADWSPDLRALCGPIVTSAVEVYNRVSVELLPTPDKSHYTFNLRDLSKVAQVGSSQGPLPSFFFVLFTGSLGQS